MRKPWKNALNIMTTTVNNNESKVLVNCIGFSGLFYKFLGEDIKIGNQILYPGRYEFDYLIKLDDKCKNGHLTFSFTGSIKIRKRNGRYYDFISGAIGDNVTYFKPELSIFEKLHTCNHLGQPMYIDNIRYHINEGKTDREISEMYNISDIKAIEILRNASDNKDLFYYLVFRLGVAENWENLANEAIREIEKRRNSKLKIEGKDRVYKQFPEKECEVLENLYQLGYASNVQKELKDKARKEGQKQKELKEIEDELYKFCIRKMSKYYKVGIKQDGVVIFTLDGKHRHEYRNICEAYLSLIEPSLSKTYKNHLDAIYKETPKEGDYVEFNLSCNADAPIYTGLILNDPGLGLVCIVDGQKIEVREMINLKVLKQEESKTAPSIQSEKESSLNDKEKDKTKQTERNNSVQPKETKPIVQYTDDMLELVSLDLDSMTYTVNGDIGTEKGIASIVLYDKIGKIVVFFNDGEKRECQFDGENILQSILKEM